MRWAVSPGGCAGVQGLCDACFSECLSPGRCLFVQGLCDAACRGLNRRAAPPASGGPSRQASCERRLGMRWSANKWNLLSFCCFLPYNNVKIFTCEDWNLR